VPAQRCTVHKHRNLLAHAPEALHEEVSADYADMIYAASATEVEAKRKAFLRKWRLKVSIRQGPQGPEDQAVAGWARSSFQFQGRSSCSREAG
jgi:hypothetical protein